MTAASGAFYIEKKNATLDGAQLSSEGNKTQITFDKYNRVFSRSSTDLRFSDEIRHKTKR